MSRVKAIYKWGITGVVVAAGAGVWYYTQGSAEAQYRFVTAAVERGDYISKVQATGTLEPQELVDVGAQVTGEIKEFGLDTAGNRVDYGSEVKAGQMLARIDDTIVELDIQRAEASVAQAKAQISQADAAVASAKAQISQAQSNLNKATRDLDRAQKLGVGEALSQLSYDEYVNAKESAQANLESAQAQLLTAEAQQLNASASLLSAEAALKSELRNRDYTRICTPVDGTIVVRQVNVGQTVVSNMSATTLFLVARDLSKMQIWTSVNEADIAKIEPGQTVQYTVDALPNRSFTGTVNKIRPNATMTSNVVTYIVEVDIDNSDRELLPYMSASAEFIVEKQENVLLVSDAAFSFRPDPSMIAEGFRGRPAGPGKPGDGPGAGPEAPAAPGAPAVPSAQGDGAGTTANGSAAEAGKPADAAGAADATGATGDRPEIPEGMKPALVWRKVSDNQVAPVRVLRGNSNGARSVIQPMPGQELAEGMELVTGISHSADTAAGDAGNKNLFAMKRPERRQRGTGGAEPSESAKRAAKNDGPPPPP